MTDNLFIVIKYGSSGHFMIKQDGEFMFNFSSPFYIDNSKNEYTSRLDFTFYVIIKEIIDGIDVWYNCNDNYDKLNKIEINDKWHIVPYSKELMSQLEELRIEVIMCNEKIYSLIKNIKK